MFTKGGTATVERAHQIDPGDFRFQVPLYTVGEAARYLGIPRRTLGYWSGIRGPMGPVVKLLEPGGRNSPVMPFVGFAEAYVASVFRRAHGLSLQYIRKALISIQAELGVGHALASERLYTDGAQILFDHRNEDDEALLLVEVTSVNVVFTDVVRDYLSRITYGPDGLVEQLVLPTPRQVAVVSPRRAYGQPLTIRGGARVIDLLDRFQAGESPLEIGEDFGVPEVDVLEIVRAFYAASPEAA